MDIREILDQYNIPYVEQGHRHCSSGFIQMDCPWCSPSQQKYRLGYNTEKRFFHCWNCGWHPLKQTIRELTGLPQEEAGNLSLRLDYIRRRRRMGLGKYTPPACIGELQKAHRAYLEGRRFDPDELVDLWGIKGIGIAPKLPWRIFIPITHQGKEVSWTTRAISNKARSRYTSARSDEESINHKNILFGFDYVTHTVCICEGPFDAMRIGRGAVAMFGSFPSSAQFLTICSIPRRIIVLDSEEQARKKALSLCHRLELYPGETINVQLDSKDPASATMTEIQAIRRLIQ